MQKRYWSVIGLLLLVLLSACGSAQTVVQKAASHPIASDSLVQDIPTPTPPIAIPSQKATPTPTQNGNGGLNTKNPATGSGAAPWGSPPPMTAEEQQFTQKLFALINSDRASRGLYAYSWNATLAGGARLHSWNMAHCGFSHTCPDGRSQCQRIADEGFAGYSDCGECIGLAGPSTPPWAHVYSVQESMVNEPPTGWHRIHLLSKTLHRVGVGIYVSNGWIYFTEDLVS